jgi:gliding motility-associated protein GldE
LTEVDSPIAFKALPEYAVSGADPIVIIGFGVLVILLFITGLLSGSELAFFSIKQEDLVRLRAQNAKGAGSVLRLLAMPEKLISTILVANNTLKIAFVLLSVFLSLSLFDFNNNPALLFLAEAAVITFLLLFFGDLVPKVYASRNNLSLALLMAPYLRILVKFLTPVTSLLISSGSFVKRRARNYRNGISMDELSDALELASDEHEEDEKILKGIVNIGNINVSAIMCPRIDVTAVDFKEPFSRIIPVIIESGFSRIPVYADTFDNVKGILYAKDVLPHINNPDTFRWQSLLRAPYFVPETKKINDLLKEFQIKKMHMAVVIDEYGGTSGIVTLEDVLEEIVGEITDESDEDEIMFRQIDADSYLFEAKILLNDFYKVFNLKEDPFELERGDSETLAGLILELTGEIPEKNKTLNLGKFTFRVESADRTRIRQVFVRLNPETDEKNEAH